ncbi:30S ribosomal protein S16 [Candidatus Kuenenbacteria bacterium RIFCSPLOWO2_12_FULL_42_13]|uniref:Small ribosomal subunit protein bS16 n=4 Tax=Candidatus Kueneniibacteriota TaxID=1752740 RepID=A0A1F6G2A9_9BACT|nr:MAG: 30S ribosomal protein S16 [Candidatus Kuenenbacteria bacterium RIFCSPLOWO2_12_FULL_42_13]OGG95723.1 MAG: 30S ribosomal protein S16 [Candidatus Kuenenbacteria bacterium RBG_16_41_7]OGG98676.1 MAG: 30S ribosomal protein S16 [Candidatus Kuenenbacteria bacterium RIFCSPHIGHO2_12_FULL_42_14]
MLMIRLSRVGKKKQPTYRIIIQDKTRDPWGKALEILGNYNPHTKAIAINQERLNYWRGVGAQMSATVNNLLIKKQIITGTKMKAARTKTQKVMAALKKKEDEKSKQETEARAKTAATAKITEEEEAKAAEESPAEEPKAEEPVTPAEKVKEEAPESESAGK